jgi:hypothetical protein
MDTRVDFNTDGFVDAAKMAWNYIGSECCGAPGPGSSRGSADKGEQVPLLPLNTFNKITGPDYV